ncbi:cyclic nucleotide-binding domain-containing protein [Streptomyces sp. SID2563]|uniref:cyclic nucleotide-binding domain-containing protein n=1 Tax=Streptomyces sp. SID2563 TaxID=2690255 RepID=UPI00136DFC42|nr:cyclic nucleotide-binding domain-containing protein [Streptomyces sp. SID2563]
MLSAGAWHELRSQGTPHTFRERSVMLRQGSVGTHLLALTGGLSKVVRREPNGVVTWLAFRGPGDLLGEVSVFHHTLRTAEVVALTPCTAVVLEAERFRRFVEERGLVMDLMRQALSRLRESDIHRTELLTLPLVVRLARALLRLVELSAFDTSAGAVRLAGLSQEEIAQAIGVSRNAVITGLQRLREAGAVETSRKVIIVKDMQVLRSWALGSP